MKNPPPADRRPRLQRFTGAAGLSVAIIGCAGFAGWIFDVRALKSVLAESVTMKANAAICFVLLGSALWILRRPEVSAASRRLARAAAAAAVALAALTLSEYAFSWDLGIDQLLFREDTGAIDSFFPGRMWVNTAICFCVAGIALLLLGSPSERTGALLIIEVAAALVASVGLFVVIGHVTGADPHDRWWYFTGMPGNSAVAFVILGAGLIAAATDRERLVWVIGGKTTAAFAGALLLLLVLAGITHKTTSTLQQTVLRSAHAQEVRFHTSQLLSAVQDVEIGQRGYLLFGRDSFLEPYRSGTRAIPAELAELRRLMADEPVQQQRLEALEAIIDAKVKLAGETLAARRPPDSAAGVDMAGTDMPGIDQASAGMDDVRSHLVRMNTKYAPLARQYEAESQAASGAVFFVLPAGGVLGFTALTVVMLLLNREAVERHRAEEEIRQFNAVLEQRVRERTAELEAANKELESFSYSVSHDLRAPLRHVQGYVELLTEAAGEKLSEEHRRYLDTIAKASAGMGELIDDLLAFSRIGRTELHKRPVSLDDLVRDTLRDLEMAVRDRNIVWKIDPLPSVIADPSVLKLVLSNLIGNAVKYTRPRDPAEIEISCAGQRDGRCLLFVRDNGVGFDMRYADKLFGVFQRMHRADEFEGTGIGLATVRRIIARHGGQTWAESAVDRGATLYFTLKPAPGAQS